MRKNRKIPARMSVLTRTTARFGAIIGILFVMVIINILATSSCQQLSKAIGLRERELDRLEDALKREATRWQTMKTVDKIDSALLRHGLAMRPPRPEQNVHMKADGTPYMSQYSVVQTKKRNGGKTAQYQGRRH